MANVLNAFTDRTRACRDWSARLDALSNATALVNKSQASLDVAWVMMQKLEDWPLQHANRPGERVARIVALTEMLQMEAECLEIEVRESMPKYRVPTP